MDIEHKRFDGAPSLARQRNWAIEYLGGTTDIIHFLDDDVTLEPDYLALMDRAFSSNPDAVGIGGALLESGRIRTRPKRAFLLRLLLLHSNRPGIVLLSGHESPAQMIDLDQTIQVEWLNGCAAYKSSILSDFKCDDALEGYSLDEDLDLSYRIGRHHKLLVEPSIRMLHRKSPESRGAPDSYYSDYLVHRFWFVKKNIDHPMKYAAFWWSTFGRILRATLNGQQEGSVARRGYFRGVRQIVTREHYLLNHARFVNNVAS